MSFYDTIMSAVDLGDELDEAVHGPLLYEELETAGLIFDVPTGVHVRLPVLHAAQLPRYAQ